MPAREFDLVIVGAGSGGLTAAGFAAQLGAKVAHEIRTASRFGINANPPVIEMANVRAYLRQAIEQVYQFESPEELQ